MTKVPDAAALVGTWVNTWTPCLGPAAVEIEAVEGGVAVHSRGPRSARRLEWPAAGSVLFAGIATDRSLAFSARRDFDDGGAVLQGNLNLGLLVLGTYRWFDGRRVGYFTREFFVRGAAAPGGDDEGDPLFAIADYPAAVDVAPVLGRWRNADAASRGIAEIRFEERGGGLGVRVLGAPARGGNDWGWTEAGVYAAVDEAGEKTLSLLASYDFGSASSRLQLRLPGGVLALGSFTAFADERRNVFTREFFYRTE